MDISTLKRDKLKVIEAISEVDTTVNGTKTRQSIAKRPFKIMVPMRYKDNSLAVVESNVFIAGIYAAIVDDMYYAVDKTNAMMRITPTSIDKTLVDDEPYYVFEFDPGSVIIPDNRLVKKDVLTYFIYDLFIGKGKVPWYLSYDDLGGIFDSAARFAGVNIGNQPELIWLLVSIIAKDPKDIHTYYRKVAKTLDDLQKIKPKYTPLQKVSTSTTNTFNKLAGNYLKEGIRSALINPAKRQERLERVLT